MYKANGHQHIIQEFDQVVLAKVYFTFQNLIHIRVNKF